MFEDGTILLVSAKHKNGGRLYKAPQHVLTPQTVADVPSFLQELETKRKAGAHLAGYLSYELGYAFEPKLAPLQKPRSVAPLAWFGVYTDYLNLNSTDLAALLAKAERGEANPADLALGAFDLEADAYGDAFTRTQRHLAEGDFYQINLTMRAAIKRARSPVALFRRLLAAQPVDYAALLFVGGKAIISLSPELFLERKGQQICSKPMKGTVARGRTYVEDLQQAEWLAKDPKSRAENTMILDLMRNDLSRVCKAGSVQAQDVCQTEAFRSLHQMTSTVVGELEDNIEFPRIIEELFPCGSITGAPKLSAMQTIDRLEACPRGVYTGSIGFIEPNGDFGFNVAIRTLELDQTDLPGTYRGVVGTGSGVVFDSGTTAEYDECKLKLRFLKGDAKPFTLFETLKYTEDDGYLLLYRHLERLKESAAYFGWSFNPNDIERALFGAVSNCGDDYRVRIDLAEDGTIAVTKTALPKQATPQANWLLHIADQRVDPADPMLYHKTSQRDLYDNARAEALARGADEAIFFNENGYLTEGTITNIMIKTGDGLVTPAWHHGLLPGTLRAGLLELRMIREADVSLSDLQNAEAIFVMNSLRGIIKAELLGSTSD
ncbi:aminodeoxychorismate synthase component I [Polycladidibacter hongkongensis]|uniref:aminodeoxychorismate synthase component I n=1 Tax=Polycladidibacter hongkongensis TaxID=1647556 RepID=UPI000831EEE0|nr:aminodeoxychorismate synthase component I [Pseudovibrio hongkongensis]